MTNARQDLDLARVRIVPATESSVFASFSSGERQIDRWVRTCCDLQKRDRVRVFCAMQDGDPLARGFYSLSVIGEKSKALIPEVVEHHNQSGFVPFIYIDFLAVERQFQNKQLGTLLISHALERAAYVAQNVGVYGIALHSLNERTTALYHRYGFRSKTKNPQHQFMAMPARTLFDLAAMARQKAP